MNNSICDIFSKKIFDGYILNYFMDNFDNGYKTSHVTAVTPYIFAQTKTVANKRQHHRQQQQQQQQHSSQEKNEKHSLTFDFFFLFCSSDAMTEWQTEYAFFAMLLLLLPAPHFNLDVLWFKENSCCFIVCSKHVQ